MDHPSSLPCLLYIHKNMTDNHLNVAAPLWTTRSRQPYRDVDFV
jgi:hypothetical protein